MDSKKMSALRPGHPVSALVEAVGAAWKEPAISAEGSFHGDGYSGRITRDGRLGIFGLTGKFAQTEPVEGVTLGMNEDAYAALHPTRVQYEENEYGWRFYRSALANGWTLEVAVRGGKVGNFTLSDPNAVYPERPYKYADPNLTEAFDLEHGPVIDLSAARPENGWCFGGPPGIATDDWPMSLTHGIPLRHAFTLKLPEAYRVRGSSLVAISVFVDDQQEEETALDTPRAEHLALNMVRMTDVLGCEYVAAWLTHEQLDGPLASPPPSNAAWLKANTQPRAIIVKRREGDPNAGKPAREWDTENEHSGYIKGFSEEGKRLGLERFFGKLAHLGGTMFPVQGYPDFSAFTLEFDERFAGFNFGGGVAQLCLKEMKLDWACG